jgi:hypothetical protein
VYLGLSVVAGDPFGVTECPKTTQDVGRRFRAVPSARGLVRVLNMLSTHAVLYLRPGPLRVLAATLEYVVDVCGQPDPALRRKLMNDVALAKLLPLFVAYAASPPPFWQSADADAGEHGTDMQRAFERLTRVQLGDGARGFFTYKADAR